jgi:hypothetical protein
MAPYAWALVGLANFNATPNTTLNEYYMTGAAGAHPAGVNAAGAPTSMNPTSKYINYDARCCGAPPVPCPSARAGLSRIGMQCEHSHVDG